MKAVYDGLVIEGQAVYADGYWKFPPTPADRAVLGPEARELPSLDQLRSSLEDVGFRVMDGSVADDEELRRFADQVRAGLRSLREERRITDPCDDIDHYDDVWHSTLRRIEGFAYFRLRKM